MTGPLRPCNGLQGAVALNAANQNPSTLNNMCTGLFYMHFSSIIMKCLAQGHKGHDRDTNPHILLNRTAPLTV